MSELNEELNANSNNNQQPPSSNEMTTQVNNPIITRRYLDLPDEEEVRKSVTNGNVCLSKIVASRPRSMTNIIMDSVSTMLSSHKKLLNRVEVQKKFSNSSDDSSKFIAHSLRSKNPISISNNLKDNDRAEKLLEKSNNIHLKYKEEQSEVAKELNDVAKDEAANDLKAEILSHILLLAETQVSALKATVKNKNGLSLTLDIRNIAALALMDLFIEGRTEPRVTNLLMEWMFTRQQILDRKPGQEFRSIHDLKFSSALHERANDDTTSLVDATIIELLPLLETVTVKTWEHYDEMERSKVMKVEMKQSKKMFDQRRKQNEMAERIALQTQRDQEAIARGEPAPD